MGVITTGFQLSSVTHISVNITGITSGQTTLTNNDNNLVTERAIKYYVDNHSGTTTYDTLLNSSLTMPSAVGGYPIGTSVAQLSGKTFITMFDDLLFPTVNPTFVNPSGTFTNPSATLHEIGETQSITFTATYDGGDILLSGVYQMDRGGAPNTYYYSGTTLPSSVSSSSYTNQQTISNYVFVVGYQTWSSSIAYNQGPQPLTNKGANYGSPLAAGTTSTVNKTHEGVYPLYATTSTITVLTKQTLVSMLTANNIQINMVAESGSNKQTFEIPTAWTSSPTNRPLSDVQTYNTVSSTWVSTGLSEWTTSASTETVQGNVINYTKYTYNGSLRGAINIRLVF